MSDSERVLDTLQHGKWQGTPLIAGGDGVKLTNSPIELEAYIGGRRLRTAAIHRGTMALRSTLRRMKYGNQETLFGDAA